MRIPLAVVVVALAALTSTGCSEPSTPQPAPVSLTDTLWSGRTAFVGDNGRVSALVDAVGFPPGDRTIVLQTATPPYGLTVEYQTLAKPFETVDFSDQATLMLGLVDNLGQVDVSMGTQTATFSSADTSSRLGYDVKRLGEDKTTLARYVQDRRD